MILWHVTDRRDFNIDPTHQPSGGNGEVGIFGAGLFLTPNPELWHYLWRPGETGGIYAAQIGGAEGVARMVGLEDRDQYWVRGEDTYDLDVLRVVPITQAEDEARRDGYGFAMIAADVIDRSIIHVIDHREGWGWPGSLCGGVTDGTPLKWTTVAWVRTGPMAGRICADCMGEV